MAAILQSLTFGTNNKATLGPCPLGSVWTVLVSVPQATNSSSFEVYLQGTQLGSMQGTATFGPFQMRGNEVLTIVSTGAAVTAAQTVTVMGQADSERNAPTGIFPVVSGGVVTTASGGSAASSFLVTPPTYYAPASLASYSLPVTGTPAPLDAINLTTGAFTAPGSGRVLIRASMSCAGSATGNYIAVALALHNLSTLATPVMPFYVQNAGYGFAINATFLLAGLTGSGNQFDLAASVNSGAGYVYAQAQSSPLSNQNGRPLSITVEAA